MMCVALFPRITVPMAVAISGEDGVREVFEDLYQRQYFVDRKVDVELTYQFHDLFREFLLARLLESRSLPELQDLQVRAGQLLEAADGSEEAVVLYRAAQAWNRIARLILLHAENRVDKGRWQTLERWFEALPISILHDDPWLMYWQAESAAVRTPKSAYALFTDAYQRFVRPNAGPPCGSV